MGHIRAWGTSVFLRFVGIRVVVRPQCKSAEYCFHHRPSFAVESSILYNVCYHFLKKLTNAFSEVIETFFQIIHFRESSSKLGVHLFKINHKEASSIHGAAANLSYQVGVIFKMKFGNIFLKKMGWGRFAHAFMGHIRACFFNVLWVFVNCTACISVPTALRK